MQLRAPASLPDRAAPHVADFDRAHRRRLRDAAVVVLPSALALALCLLQITGRSLALDESASVAIASQHGSALGSAIAHDGGNMSGYYWLLHLLIGAFGDGMFVLRAPSAVAASITVGLVGVLAVRLFDWRVALGSGVLAAVSLPLVFWGQAARGYAPMIALVTASFVAFVALVDGRGGPRVWIAYVACTTLAAYTGIVALLIVPAQLLVLCWHRRRAPAVLSAVTACAACCAPLAVLAARRGSGQLFWVPRPDLGVAKQAAQALTSSGLEPNFHPTSTSAVLLVVTLVALAAVAGTVATRIARRDASSQAPALLLSWLLVPIVLTLAESAVGQSIFVPRNLLVSLPAVALLLAYGIFDRRIPSAVAWSSLLVLLALRALQLGPSYGVSPENWKGAAAFVATRANPADCVAFYPSDGRMAFRYYVAAPPLRAILPSAPWGQVRQYVENYAVPPQSQLARLRTACSRLWLISGHVGQPDGPRSSRLHHQRYVRLRTRLLAQYGRPDTATFGYAPPVRVELFAAGRSLPVRAGASGR